MVIMFSLKQILWALLLTLAFSSNVTTFSDQKELRVRLQASWTETPLALEMIEAINYEAKQKTSSELYYSMLDAIAEEELVINGNDKQVYDNLKTWAVSTAKLDPESWAFVDASLGLHRFSPLVSAQFQMFDTSLDIAKSSCRESDNLFIYGDEVLCDQDSLFALKTTSESSKVLVTDKVLQSDIKAPSVILYSDPTSEDFSVFYSLLAQSARDGKIRLIVRFKPKSGLPNTKSQLLTGYGVDLALKRTDYLVIDDNDNNNGGQIALDTSSKASSISKQELALIGISASRHIMDSDNSMETLVDITNNFPSLSNVVAKSYPSEDDFLRLSRFWKGTGISGGENRLLINGAPAFHQSQDDYLTLLEKVEFEKKTVDLLTNIAQISRQDSLQLIGEDLFQGENANPSRFDIRNSVTFWLNDMENDPAYDNWSDDIESLLLDLPFGQFHRVKKNINSLLIVASLDDVTALEMIKTLIVLVQRGIGLRVGIVPIATTSESEVAAKLLYDLIEREGRQDALSYLYLISNGATAEESYKRIAHASKINTDVLESASNYVALANNFANDLSLQSTSIFANGRLVLPSKSWLQEAAAHFAADLDIFRAWIKTDNVPKNFQDQLLEQYPSSRSAIIAELSAEEALYATYDEITGLYNHDSISFDGTDLAAGTIWYRDDFVSSKSVEQIIQMLKVEESTIHLVPVISDFSGIGVQKKREGIIMALTASTSRADAITLLDIAIHLLLNNDSPTTEESKILESHGLDDNFVSLTDAKPGVSSSPTTHGVHGKIVLLGRYVSTTNLITTEDFKILVESESKSRLLPLISALDEKKLNNEVLDKLVAAYERTTGRDDKSDIFDKSSARVILEVSGEDSLSFKVTESDEASVNVVAVIDPMSVQGRKFASYVRWLSSFPHINIVVMLNPSRNVKELPLKSYYRSLPPSIPSFDDFGDILQVDVVFDSLPQDLLMVTSLDTPTRWVVMPKKCDKDLDNVILQMVDGKSLDATYELTSIILEGHALEPSGQPPRGLAIELESIDQSSKKDTQIMANFGYFQLQANPGLWNFKIKQGRGTEVFHIEGGALDFFDMDNPVLENIDELWLHSLNGHKLFPRFKRNKGMQMADVLQESTSGIFGWWNNKKQEKPRNADINIFTVASGHLYERFLSIMTDSVMRHTNHTVKFWLIENFLSPSFKEFLPHLADEFGFEYELVTYKWPSWLRGQTEKQRTIWGYKILFLDVLFPQTLDKVIFVDSDQIVRTDMKELIDLDLHGAPYGFTPMGDSRKEIEGYRFWKQGYWKTLLGDRFKYHISALYVVDLKRFRQLAAGDILRGTYQRLSADPNSLSNLDQDLPNNIQQQLPIFSLPDDWLWCETWCSDESLATAKTIDLCNNPMTKEPKLDRARRQIPEWNEYDQEIAALRRKYHSTLDDKQQQSAMVQIGVDARSAHEITGELEHRSAEVVNELENSEVSSAGPVHDEL